jgi:hypothetical protein
MHRPLIIEFEDYPGHEVETILTPVPVAAYLEVNAQLRNLRMNPESFRALFDAFAPFLVRWTFDEPADADGLMQMDYNLAIAIVNQWSGGVRDVPLPLPRRPSDGTPSEEPQE